MKTVVLCGITLLAVVPAFAQTSAPAAGDPSSKTVTLTGCVGGGADSKPITLSNALIVPGTPQPGQMRYRHRFPRRCRQLELNRRIRRCRRRPRRRVQPVPSPTGTSGTKTPPSPAGTSGVVTGTAPAGSSGSS